MSDANDGSNIGGGAGEAGTMQGVASLEEETNDSNPINDANRDPSDELLAAELLVNPIFLPLSNDAEIMVEFGANCSPKLLCQALFGIRPYYAGWAPDEDPSERSGRSPVGDQARNPVATKQCKTYVNQVVTEKLATVLIKCENNPSEKKWITASHKATRGPVPAGRHKHPVPGPNALYPQIHYCQQTGRHNTLCWWICTRCETKNPQKKNGVNKPKGEPKENQLWAVGKGRYIYNIDKLEEDLELKPGTLAAMKTAMPYGGILLEEVYPHDSQCYEQNCLRATTIADPEGPEKVGSGCIPVEIENVDAVIGNTYNGVLTKLEAWTGHGVPPAQYPWVKDGKALVCMEQFGRGTTYAKDLNPAEHNATMLRLLLHISNSLGYTRRFFDNRYFQQTYVPGQAYSVADKQPRQDQKEAMLTWNYDLKITNVCLLFGARELADAEGAQDDPFVDESLVATIILPLGGDRDVVVDGERKTVKKGWYLYIDSRTKHSTTYVPTGKATGDEDNRWSPALRLHVVSVTAQERENATDERDQTEQGEWTKVAAREKRVAKKRNKKRSRQGAATKKQRAAAAKNNATT